MGRVELVVGVRGTVRLEVDCCGVRLWVIDGTGLLFVMELGFVLGL